MVIACYVDFKAYRAPDAYFVKSLIDALAINTPSHKLHLLTTGGTNEIDKEFLHLILLQIKPGFFYQYRLEKKVVQIIKKIKADVLFSFDAILNSTCSQSAFMSSLNKKQNFSATKLQRLKTIFVLSEIVKATLIEKHKVDVKKIKMLYGGPSGIFVPVSEEQKTLIKEKYTGGKEYFFYLRNTKNAKVILLLKAFSFFKKRQKSEMKLLIVEKMSPKAEFDKLISTYKYRDELVIVNPSNEIEEAQLVASAYAIIESYIEHGLFVFNAMKCGVPVLIPGLSPLATITGDAVFYFESENYEDIADKMMLVYKDELLRNRLIEKGKELVNQYSWEKTAEVVWQSL